MVSLEDIWVSYGGFDLLRGVGFMLQEGDRAGLVGRNGSGKTTLIKMIAGEAVPTKGRVNMQGGINIGYLPQHLTYSDTTTVFEETRMCFSELLDLQREQKVLEEKVSTATEYESQQYFDLLDRFHVVSERIAMLESENTEEQIEKTLTGLGFKRSDFTRATSEFSGGWRMRIELAKILLIKPHVMLLDEPTNHLDMPSIQWLEDMLKEYRGALLLVSHDRMFLDNVTNRTIEITLGKIYDYKVPYTKYLGLSEERRITNRAAWENQQKQIKDTEEFIERFRYKATKAVQVQSRIRQLEKLERVELEETDSKVMHFRFQPAPHSGNIIIEAKEVSKSYDALNVFRDVTFTVEKGEKIAFVGRNGEGKTTMSRIVTGELEYDGFLKHGAHVKTGYFAQNQHLLLNESKTIFQTLDDVAVGDIRTRIKAILGSFLFGGEDIDKKVSVLSGGEKSRLALAQMLLTPYNLLVLDEPTNHLDMLSREILKKALQQFDGTLIIVSHDRYFLEGLATRVIEFTGGKIYDYPGTITEFLDHKRIESLQTLNRFQQQAKSAPKEVTDTKADYLEKKEVERLRRKLTNAVDRLEKEIATLETDMRLVEKKLTDPSIYNEILHNELLRKYNELKTRNDKALEEWEKASGELEEFRKRNG